MKPIYVVLFLMVLLLVACVNKYGSGKIVSEERKTEPFNSIDVGSDFKIEITQGSEFQVDVEADDNVMPYIKTQVHGSVLEIKLLDHFHVSNAHMTVKITMPEVKDISASASADVFVNNTLSNNNNMSFDASSSATIVAEVNTPNLKLSTSSAGRITVSGKCKNLDTEASSGSEITAPKLMSEEANADASSGASINIFCSVSLKADASSGSKVLYGGNPTKTAIDANSGGDVRKVN